MSENRTGADMRVRGVMLFRDARGWGVSASVGPRTQRHWRFHTERQARFMAAVLELGPRVLPAGSSGTRRHARVLGMREGPVRPRGTHCGGPRTPWPGGAAADAGPCEGSAVPAGRFGSLCSALEAGLELAASPTTSRTGGLAGGSWHFGHTGAGSGEADGSLSSALDAALDQAFGEGADDGAQPLDEEEGSRAPDAGVRLASG